MQVFLAADHAGFKLKEAVKKELSEKHEIIDVTPTLAPGDDYPLVAKKLVNKIRGSSFVVRGSKRGTSNVGRGTIAVFICGSGVGAAIAANRYKNIRAAQGYSAKEVKLAREHNDINVLTLSGWNTKLKDALALIAIFLKTPASKAARHKRRIKQLSAVS